MADEEIEPTGERQQGSSRQQKVTAGVLGLLALLVGYNLFFGGNGGNGGDQRGGGDNPAAEQQDQQQAQDGGGGGDGDNTADGGGGDSGAADIAGPTGDKAVKVLSESLKATEQKLAEHIEKANKRAEQQQARVDRLKNEVTQKLQSMTDIIQTIKERQKKRDYQRGIPDNDATGADGSQPDLPDSDGGGDKNGGDSSPYAYKPLYGGSRTRASKAANQALSNNSGAGGGDNIISSDQPGQGGGGSNAATGGGASLDNGGDGGQGDGGDGGDGAQKKTKDITIGAAAMARATNLNGADCPIGLGNVKAESKGGGTGKDLFGLAPVYIQLRGPFRGANNKTTDIGKAQLLGFCTGIRNGSRARIVIERLQYNHRGKSHTIDDISATVIDADRPEQRLDINGTLISDKSSDAFIASLLQGLQSAGQIGVQKEFTESTNQSGGTTRALTGSPESAAASAFAKGVSSRILDIYIKQLEQNVDVVSIPAGEDMLVVLSRPITISNVRTTNADEQQTGGLAPLPGGG